MIGKAYVSTFKYYNNRTHRLDFKNRPVLIIGQADSTDYVILPVSRVTNQNNLDHHYDVVLEPEKVPLLHLKERSFVRTHKQSIVNAGELTRKIVDFRKEYPDIYRTIIARMEEFQKNLVVNALHK